jgi:CBS domain containing-hemolysin-like protein
MAPELLGLLGIIALVFANGVFVGAEFAFIGSSRPKIEALAAAGRRRAKLVLDNLLSPQRQDFYVATTQVGITLASLGLGMWGEPFLAEMIQRPLERLGAPAWLSDHSVTAVVAIAILTVLHIVIGEMVPKAMALAQPEQSAIRLEPLMAASKIAFYPLVLTLNACGNLILRLFGVRRVLGAEHVTTPEELQLIVEESTAVGLLREGAGSVLSELIEFSERNASAVMVPRVHITGVPVGCTTSRLREIIRADLHTRYPVYTEDLDHIIGMVHIKDLLRIVLAGRPVIAQDARPIPRVPETTELDTVLDIMRKDGAQAVVVMDEHGGTAGMITMEDLFEEVVGEIEEDFGEPPEIRKETPERIRVLGTVRLEEVGEALGRELLHEEVETVSGLILAILERPPAVGDLVRYEGLRFQVTEVAGHGVSESVIEVDHDPPPPPRRPSIASVPPQH